MRAGLDKRPADVAAMFDRVAQRYDVTNTVLSGGRDVAWRRATRAALDPRPGQVVLDVAAGTAVSPVELAAGRAAARTRGVSLGAGRGRAPRPGPHAAGGATSAPLSAPGA